MAPTATLVLRSETKHLEHRSALTPSTTKALVDAGYTVKVERSPGRVFDDAEFAAVGATLVPEGVVGGRAGRQHHRRPEGARGEGV